MSTALLGLAFAIPMLGCSPKPPPIGPETLVSDNPEVEKQYRQGRELFDRGELDAADVVFARLAEEHPKDPLARAVVIYRARVSLLKKNPLAARQQLKPIVGDADPIAERAAFYDGIALYALGQYEIAIKRLAPFVDRLTDPEENRTLLETLWKAANFAGDKVRAIVWLDKFLAQVTDEGDRESAQKTADALCRQIEDIERLETIEPTLDSDGAVWPLVMAKMAQIYFDDSKWHKVRRILSKVERKGREETPAIQAIAVRLEQRETVDLTSVGLIVPLSGRSRLVGESVVRGAMLGAKVLSIGNGRAGLTVVIRDSESNPAAAAKTVEELVYSERVAAIVGPVDSAASEAAAVRAQALGVPMLALSIGENLTEIGPFVFREFGTGAREIEALVDISERQGNQRFFVFYPDNGYGKAMRNLLETELLDRGIDFAGELAYAHDETTFFELAKRLAETDFDALLIPDQAARIALIAPALAAAGLWSTRTGEAPNGPGRPIQLLIPSPGVSEDLTRRAGRYLQGALFSTFFYKNANAGTRDFADQFHRAYGVQPNYLAGFGYDAMLLIADAIRGGASDRDAIRSWLTDSKGAPALPLSTPFSGFSENGEPMAPPIVLELTDSTFSELK